MVTRGSADDTGGRRASRRTHRPLVVGALAAAIAVAVGLGGGPAGALSRFPGPWQRDHDGVEHSTDGRGRDRGNGHHDEGDDDCPAAGPSTTSTSTTAPSPSAASVGQTVTVVVPPIVRVRAATGRDLTVLTNSGRPPAPGDQVYVEAPDGGLSPADAALVARVMSARWEEGSWCSTTEEHHSRNGNANGNGGDRGHGRGRDDRS